MVAAALNIMDMGVGQAAVPANMARLNITYQRQNGDLPDPVAFDAADGDIRQWVTEAVRTGSVPGIGEHAQVDLRNFIIERFASDAQVPYNRIFVRPKTEFG